MTNDDTDTDDGTIAPNELTLDHLGKSLSRPVEIQTEELEAAKEAADEGVDHELLRELEQYHKNTEQLKGALRAHERHRQRIEAQLDEAEAQDDSIDALAKALGGAGGSDGADEAEDEGEGMKALANALGGS